MCVDKEIQKNNYFEYRQVDSSSYEAYKCPMWLKNELGELNLKILDYGCGFGQTLEALRVLNFKNLYGVDIENEAISHCLGKKLNIKQLDLENLKNPFEIKFDVIILTHVLEHISKDDIITTLSFIKKQFLAENGKLLIAVPNAQSNTDCYWAYEDWTHSTLFTSGSLFYVLKAAGFETIAFLDQDCTLGNSRIKILFRRFFLKLYRINKTFWNKVTCSYYHEPSPKIFSYEIKVKAY
jgi:SAM-dependent methyltransferase